MKVLFVNYHHLDSNSGIHIFNLANCLVRLGVECIVCVPWEKERVKAIGEPLFEVVNIDDMRKERMKRRIDLIHVWTPREIVRRITHELLGFYTCPYIVHLEDNEEFLIEKFARVPLHILKHFPISLQSLFIPRTISHPTRYKEFLGKASGITVIMESLKAACPEMIPNKTIWAGYQEDIQWDMSPDLEFKRSLGISLSEFVVGYTGNVHPANREEVASLYQAVQLIYRRGFPIKLVRTGTDYVSFLDRKLRLLKPNFCIELGHISRQALPSLLSIADVLIQPGVPGQFNDYRFPSKIPEYLASGKPVILPKTNIGLHLKDNKECLLLDEGNVLDISQKLEILFSDASLRKKIGLGGRKFAEKHLRWGHIAGQLHSFYTILLNGNPGL